MVVSSDSHRVMVTVSKSQNDLLEVLAEFQNRTKGSYLRELLDSSEPVLRALLPLLKLHAATLKNDPLPIRDVFNIVITRAFLADPDQVKLIEALTDPDVDWDFESEQFEPPQGFDEDGARNGRTERQRGRTMRRRKVAS